MKCFYFDLEYTDLYIVKKKLLLSAGERVGYHDKLNEKR